MRSVVGGLSSRCRRRRLLRRRRATGALEFDFVDTCSRHCGFSFRNSAGRVREHTRSRRVQSGGV